MRVRVTQHVFVGGGYGRRWRHHPSWTARFRHPLYWLLGGWAVEAAFWAVVLVVFFSLAIFHLLKAVVSS